MKTWDFVGPPDTAWVDLPAASEIQALPYLAAPLREELTVRLKDYHRLPKSVSAYLSDRSEKLAGIRDFLRMQELEISLMDCLLWLARLAEAKAIYLASLRQIFSEAWDQPEQIQSYLNLAAPSPWQALTLTRERYLFPERGVFWGNYTMECLDPSHRQLPGFYKVWEGLPNPDKPHYLLWLEDFSSFKHEHWVRYLSRDEADELLCRSEGGLLVKASGRPLSCPERQHFLFVIDLEKKLFVSRAEPHLCHASYTRGQPVLAAGVLQAREGRVTHLKFESGHYLSGPREWWQAITLLHETGINLDNLRITIFDRYRYQSRIVARGALLKAESFFGALGVTPP